MRLRGISYHNLAPLIVNMRSRPSNPYAMMPFLRKGILCHAPADCSTCCNTASTPPSDQRPAVGKSVEYQPAYTISRYCHPAGSGADIEGEPGIGYRLKPGFTLPPLMFSHDELAALVLGSRWVAERTDIHLSRAATRLRWLRLRRHCRMSYVLSWRLRRC